MNKIAILIAFNLFFVNILTAQIKIKDNIEWLEPEPISIKNGFYTQKFCFLKFNGSVPYNSLLFPAYVKTIELPYYAEIEVKLKVFRTHKFNDNCNVLGWDRLGDNWHIEYYVSFKRHKPYLIITILPFRKNGKELELLDEFELDINYQPKPIPKSSHKFASESVLKSGRWYKIAIPKDGVYILTFEQLRQLGFNNPQNVRIFGNDFGQLPYYNNKPFMDDLAENKIFIGPDYILFYAEAAKQWYYDESNKFIDRLPHDYCDTAYYFITDLNTGYDNVIDNATSPLTPNKTVDYYTWYGDYELNKYNFLRSGRLWFGLYFYNQTVRNYKFEVNNILQKNAKAKIAFLGRNYVTAYVTAYHQDYSKTVPIPSITGLLGTDWGKVVTFYLDFVPQVSSDLIISVKYNGVLSSSRGFMDYIVVNLPRKLEYQGEQLIFSNIDVIASDAITEFKIYNVPTDAILWDVTNTLSPVKLNLTYQTTYASFVSQTADYKRFVLFRVEDAYSPVLDCPRCGVVANQNIHATPAQTDMLIITHPKFLEAAKVIKSYHEQAQNIDVYVATTEQIYNEYSSGIPDVVALRNYIRSVYLKPNSELKWVLLFGDGSYKNECSGEDESFVFTYQTLNSLNTNSLLSLTSDDFFGLLDENEGETVGLMDVAVGRLPVRTEKEAMDMANKIWHYLFAQDKTDWKSYLVFVADDATQNIFMTDAENISSIIYQDYPQFNVKKIYIDAYEADILFGGEEFPGAVSDVKNRVENGSLIICYLGHGNEEVLTSERVITISDVRNWENLNRLNVFVVGTCEFGRFDESIWGVTGGEAVVLNPKGGAIAFYGTTRISYSSVNFFMNREFFEQAFIRDNGRRLTIGEIVVNAKNAYPVYYNREFILLGDPALTLDYPENYVVIDSLSEDTLKALSKVKLWGKVVSPENQIIEQFNGVAYITIFDKLYSYWTLNNDYVGAFEYKDYKNVIFRGMASVVNGRFELEFWVPKDIYPNIGEGKIIVYATDGNLEALGAKKILIGGTAQNAVNDNKGPKIKMFLNDSSFVNGSITGRSPKLVVILEDETAINTTSSGLGHELQIILDNKQRFIVNDYFIADKDKPNSGKLEYTLYKLEPGEHNLKFIAYDIFNNKSEAQLNFKVTDDSKFILGKVFNYPNPFTTSTWFYFEHNQAGKRMQVVIQIFSVSGRLVKTLTTQMQPKSFISEPIFWDGTDQYGKKIAKGVYFYILSIKTEDGTVIRTYGKVLKI